MCSGSVEECQATPTYKRKDIFDSLGWRDVQNELKVCPVGSADLVKAGGERGYCLLPVQAEQISSVKTSADCSSNSPSGSRVWCSGFLMTCKSQTGTAAVRDMFMKSILAETAIFASISTKKNRKPMAMESSIVWIFHLHMLWICEYTDVHNRE